jgi:hypothetical protein
LIQASFDLSMTESYWFRYMPVPFDEWLVS